MNVKTLVRAGYSGLHPRHCAPAMLSFLRASGTWILQMPRGNSGGAPPARFRKRARATRVSAATHRPQDDRERSKKKSASFRRCHSVRGAAAAPSPRLFRRRGPTERRCPRTFPGPAFRSCAGGRPRRPRRRGRLRSRSGRVDGQKRPMRPEERDVKSGGNDRPESVNENHALPPPQNTTRRSCRTLQRAGRFVS